MFINYERNESLSREQWELTMDDVQECNVLNDKVRALEDYLLCVIGKSRGPTFDVRSNYDRQQLNDRINELSCLIATIPPQVTRMMFRDENYKASKAAVGKLRQLLPQIEDAVLCLT